MDKFIELLKSSVIVQGLVTLGWGVTTSILLIERYPVDEKWWIMGGVIIGFWFGGKAVLQAQSIKKVGKNE